MKPALPTSDIGLIPDGSFTLSKREKSFPSGVWSLAERGDGPYLFCTNGRRYLDWMCGLGALTVGHNHPKVVEAVTKQMREGAIFSLPSKLEGKVAERLCEVIPCAEMVKVVKTGSEACSAAVRIARIATGRQTIITTETSYHGWHDTLIAAKPRHPGVPPALEWTINAVPYNDLAIIEKRMGEFTFIGKPVAAIMLEPVQGEEPRDDYLQKLIDLAHDRGALVIFDEMLCGGRLALGGAQEYYKVTPDLATFGKAFGGGLPFAFVCGRRDIMEHAWPISGTFSGDALGLAACNAMLDLYNEEEIIKQLWCAGARVRGAILGVADGYVRIHGHFPRFWLTWNDDQRLCASVFVQECARHDLLVHPNVCFASAALTAEHCEESARVMYWAAEMVVAGLKHGNLSEKLVGHPYEDSVR